MKTAIIHDVFIEKGGAERVLLALLELFPDADVFIPLVTLESIVELKSNTNGRIYTSLLNRIPFIHSASIILKPFLYWYWEHLNLQKYQLVISSSHSFSSKSVITSPNCVHISYIHTPPRYLYAEFNETRFLRFPILGGLLTPLLSWLRQLDYLGGQRPDILIANSRTVQKRISKYYRRTSTVVYPPIKIPDRLGKKAGKYFLCYSRLAKQKGTELAIQACNELQLPLLVVGTGSEAKYLKSISGSTISFAGYVPDEEIDQVFFNATALIYCSIEEDFGMAPVEAMAHGVPVIAYDSGGTSETVIEGKTGTFFQDFSVNSLADKLLSFKPEQYSAAACKNQASKFSEATFKKHFRQVVRNST